MRLRIIHSDGVRAETVAIKPTVAHGSCVVLHSGLCRESVLVWGMGDHQSNGKKWEQRRADERKRLGPRRVCQRIMSTDAKKEKKQQQESHPVGSNIHRQEDCGPCPRSPSAASWEGWRWAPAYLQLQGCCACCCRKK